MYFLCFQVWFDIHTFKKHNGGQNLYIPVTISSVRCLFLISLSQSYTFFKIYFDNHNFCPSCINLNCRLFRFQYSSVVALSFPRSFEFVGLAPAWSMTLTLYMWLLVTRYLRCAVTDEHSCHSAVFPVHFGLVAPSKVSFDSCLTEHC